MLGSYHWLCEPKVIVIKGLNILALFKLVIMPDHHSPPETNMQVFAIRVSHHSREAYSETVGQADKETVNLENFYVFFMT